MILRGGLVVTMDDERRVLPAADVLLRDGVVAAITGAGDAAPEPGEEVVDCAGLVVTPGLINAHVHLTGPALLPGAEPGEDPVADHFPRWVLPAHEHSGPEDERAAARLTALMMLRTGTTAFLEAGVCRFPDAVLDGLADLGLRGAIGTWAADEWPFPEAFAATTAQVVRRIDDALALTAPPGGRLRVLPNLIGHTGCSDALVADAAGRGLPWTLHMAAFPDDGEAYRARTGREPLEHLHALGALDARVTVAHGIHLGDADLAALAASGATVAYCPGASVRLATGVVRAGRHDAMEHVALGTDTTNASNHVDLLRSADLACAVYAEARGDRGAVTAERALEWLWHGGARALGLADAIGRIEPGRRGDVAVFEPGQPVLHAANALVHGSPRAVHAFVDGEPVLRDGRVPGAEAILADARAAAERVAGRAGLPLVTGWGARYRNDLRDERTPAMLQPRRG